MSEQAEQRYNELLEKAKNDDRIIGFILTGSRGKNMVTEYSDYDIALIATDEGFGNADKEYKKYKKTEEIDIGVKSLSDFKNHAASGNLFHESSSHASVPDASGLPFPHSHEGSSCGHG